MPDSPTDPSPGAKPPLPHRRPQGEQPRSFADQVVEPILPSGPEARSTTATTDGSVPREKTALPSHRRSERELPIMTPAPYQSESVGDSTPVQRTALPTPRSPDEAPKFRSPHAGDHDAPPRHLVTDAPDDEEIGAPPPAPAPVPAAPRPANRRLAANRQPAMKRQDVVETDPEITDAWGNAESDNQTGHKRSHRLILWASLIGAPLAALALWHSLGRPGATPPSQSSTPVAARPPASADAAEESRKAVETIKRFLATTTLDDRAAHVRHPEITKPRMAAWYSAANPIKPLEVIEVHDRTTEQTIDGISFLMLQLDLSDNTTRFIAVEKLPDGRGLVDWESFVFWSAPRWPEFLSTEPAGSHEFRALVEIDNYFNFGYPDGKEWFCYKLTDPENWANCWGYCPIDSEAGMQINRMLRRQRLQGEDQIKAVLQLKFEDAGKGRNQVLIEKVVQDGWIKVGP